MSAFKFQWVPHNGGPMPVSAETLVEVRFKGPMGVEPLGAQRGDSWVWRHDGMWDDIIAYRVIEVRP